MPVPGIGAADQVVAAHDDGDDGALDRRRRGESANADAFDQRGLEPERVEADRLGIVRGLRPGHDPGRRRHLEMRRGACGARCADLAGLVVPAALGAVLYVNSKSWF